MHIIPSPDGRRFDRRLATSTGEAITEAYIVGALLASGSFANRPQVEAEVEAVFDLLTQVFERLKEKREPRAKQPFSPYSVPDNERVDHLLYPRPQTDNEALDTR